MKEIYQNQGSVNLKPASGLTMILLLFLLTISSLVSGGTVSGTFTTLPDCPVSLNAMCVDPATGFLYALGNANDSAYYKYNISTSTWSVLASAPHKTNNNAGATLLNGKIYISYTQFPDLAVYTIATDSWTTITGPAGGTYTGNISTNGTDIYVCGYDGGSTFWKYAISTNTWVSLATLNWGDDNAWGGLCYNNGYFYHDAGDNAYTFDRYLVATNSWETLPNIPNSDGAVLGAAIYDAYYYCMGGYNGTNLYSYDLGAQEWNNTLTLPWSINDATICVYQGSLYIIQGEAGIGFTKFTPNNPMLTNMEPALLRYTFGAAAIQITNTLTAAQNSGTNFQSATVSVASNYETGKDVLSFVNAYGLTGSWSSATGVLTLTGSATIATYQAALRTVKYFNSNTTSSGLRRIEFQVYDGTVFSNIAGRNLAFPGPAVTTNPITNINASSATSGGNVIDDGGSAITARGICWNTTGTPTIANAKTSDGTGTGSFTSSMTGLVDGTTYYVRAYATSSVTPGKVATLTAYGEERTFIAAEFYVNAGPDASTCGSDYFLSGVAGGAYSADITSWSTTGDGYFNNEYALQTTYYAGTNDLSTGFTTLTLNATFADPASTTVSDEMTLSFTTSVGGAVTGETTVCTGTNSTLLTLVGSLGVIQKWQYSTNDTTWSDISTATTATYTATNLTDSTWFRALVKNGATCNVATSDPALISIEQPAVTGTLAKTPDVATVFAGTDVSAVLTPGTGGAGTDALNYRTKTGTTWGSFMEYISGTAISTTGKTGVSIRTWREAIACDPDSQVAVEWAVESKPSAGAIAANQTICNNTTPAAFTSTTAGTGIGSISYEWQTNATGSYVTITGDTLATYQAPALTATTSYQRRTVATVSGTKYYSDYTTAVTITVRPVFTAGSIKKSGEVICYNGDPAQIGDSIAASGGNAPIFYQWQSSLNAGFTETPTVIATNASSYNPPANLTSTTWYRRQAKDATCNLTFTSSAQVWKVTVNPVSNGGNVSGGAIVCNGTNSTVLTLSGQTGTVVKWQYTTDAGNNWSDIASATSTTYTATNLITTTSFRAVVQSGVCAATPGGYANVTVRPVFTAGSIKKSGETICYNGDPVQIVDSISASGGDAAIEYQWQSSLNAGFTETPTDIATNAASYNPPANLTATTWYRRQAKDGTCNITFTSSAQVWKVTVRPVFTAGSIKKSGETICYNGDPAQIGDSIAASGGNAPIFYQWQSSLNAGFTGTPTDIATNAASYNPPANLTATTWYRRQAKDGTCNTSWNTSAEVWKVTVNPASNGGNISGGAYVCNGTNSTVLTLSGQTGTVVKWQYTTDGGNNWSDIASATSTTYTATNLVTTTSYRAVVQSGVCAATPGGYANVNVQSVLTAGAIGTSQSICYNTVPALLTSTAGTGSGTITYEWQNNATGSYVTIDGATDATYQPLALTATTSYQRRTVSTSGGNACYSGYTTAVTKTVYPQFTSGSILTTGETICYSGDPAEIGNSTVASGGFGPITYQWQSSTNVGFTGTPTTLGTNAASYNPPTGLTVNTWYRRQAVDSVCNTTFASSTGVWKVSIETTPPVALAKNITIYLNAVGSATLLATDIDNVSTDNCSIATRVASKTTFACADKGANTVTLTVTDAAGNSATATCTVTVRDIINPTAQAKNISITLSPAGTASIVAADINNGSSDNCTLSLSASKTTFDCTNLGPNTVTLTVTDASSNTATATSVVTVVEGTDLPTPWQKVIIGNSSGTAIYTPCTGPRRYTLKSKGFSAPTADVQESVYQPLTGNGYIIVRIIDLTYNGWAGVQIRESSAQGAKKVLLKTQFQTYLKSEIRQTTGGSHSSSQIMGSGVKWLKLSRTGNSFTAYTSVNGSGWTLAFNTTVSMGNTVQIGFFSESMNTTTVTQARFDNVSVTRPAKSSETENLVAKQALQIDLYPNPASDFVTVSIPAISTKVHVSVFSAEGKMLHSETIDQTATQLDVSYLKPGIYFLKFEADGEMVTRRLVVY